MNPTATLTLARPATDRDWVWLSESLTATLRVEGPAPLVVVTPKDWLRADAAGSWQATAIGNPKTEKRPDGTVVWTQALRLDPFVPGEAVTLAFNPLTVTAGGRGEAMMELSSHSVQVKTRFENPKATDALPITGFEDPPPAPPPPVSPWPPVLGGVAIALVAILFVLRKRRPAPTPAATPLELLAALEAKADALDGRAFAEELARIVRLHLETAHAIPATRLTTGELADAPPTDQFKSVLDWCDRVRFGGEDAMLRREMVARVAGTLRVPSGQATTTTNDATRQGR